jgi:hypothetical protein
VAGFLQPLDAADDVVKTDWFTHDQVRSLAGRRSGCGRWASAMQPEATMMVSGWLYDAMAAMHAAGLSACLVAMYAGPVSPSTTM